MAHNLAFEELERQVSKALEGGKDFAYETNFNSTPLFGRKNSKLMVMSFI
jgi:hypothetical protein